MNRHFGSKLACILALSLVCVSAPGDEWESNRMQMVRAIEGDVRATAEYIGTDELDPRVMEVMSMVPRHEFVPDSERPYSYLNRPLPIGYGQTISQPYIVALMTHMLQPQPHHRVLEVGTGSGYQAAVLSHLVDKVYTIEIIEELAARVGERLDKLGYRNIQTRLGDGFYGWPEAAPFDGIVVTAAGSQIPPPLIDQLKPGGRMAIPVGNLFSVQHLLLVEKSLGGEVTTRQVLPVRFVPLTGSLCALDLPAPLTLNISHDSGIKTPWVGVFAISGCALGYELLLIRLLGIVQWYHYGYMIISLALLGHGASGTFIAIFQERLLPRYRAVFLVNGILFAASAVTCFLVAQHIPFNNLAMLWDGRQWLWLTLIFLLLLIPFLLAANCIGLTLCRFNRSIPRIYACDLLGAALGAAAAVLALYVLHPLAALLAFSIVTLVAFAHTARKWFPDRRFHWMILGLGLVLFGLPQSWLTLQPAAYKPLSKALLLPETRIEGSATSPLGMLEIVSSPVIPFRHAPGLSINSRSPIPEQLGIFNDGGEFDALSKHDGDSEGFAYLEDMLSALPYRVLENPSVLLLGLGGGDGLRQAARLGASNIDVVEFDARRARLVLEDFVDYAAWPELFPQPRVLRRDPRAHLSSSASNYDLIRLEIPGAQSLSSLRPEYRLTRQALDLYLDSLTKDGILAVHGTVELPPRSALRILATAAAILKHRDLDPAQHVVLLRNWSTWIVLVSNHPWEATRISILRSFSRELAFDTAYFPGIAPGESNTFNRIADDTFHLAAEALLGAESSNFIERYKFRIAPTSDDRPHFYQFLTWPLAWEWLSLRDRGGMALMDDGFPVLLATLAQAALVSIVLIVLPLVFYKSSTRRDSGSVSSLSLFAYFFLVGLAFIAIEIAVIQKLVLLLSHPGFSIPLAIAAFLLFAGLGSLWVRRYPPGSRVPAVACGVTATVSVLFLLLNPVIPQLMSLPVAVRVLLALLLTAPLGFVMGMPFPAALELVASRDVGRLPWCWAINGCASVLSAVSSMALAILFGYSATMIIAAALYLAAIPAVRRISAAT